jgi:hypothetical protein
MGRDGYILPFEAVSILLLAAMVGCIAIAYKEPIQVSSNGKTQELSEVVGFENEVVK